MKDALPQGYPKPKRSTTDIALPQGYPKHKPKRCCVCQRSEQALKMLDIHLSKMLGAKINAPMLQYVCSECKRR